MRIKLVRPADMLSCTRHVLVFFPPRNRVAHQDVNSIIIQFGVCVDFFYIFYRSFFVSPFFRPPPIFPRLRSRALRGQFYGCLGPLLNCERISALSWFALFFPSFLLFLLILFRSQVITCFLFFRYIFGRGIFIFWNTSGTLQNVNRHGKRRLYFCSCRPMIHHVYHIKE